MPSETEGQAETSMATTVVIRGGGSAYAVPLAVMERHRVAPERRAQVEAELGEQRVGDLPPAEEPLWELTTEALAPYRLSDEERVALEAERAGEEDADDAWGFCSLQGGHHGVYPTNPYTGYSRCTVFDLSRTRGGLVGVFPKYQAPSSSGPYPGLR